MSESPIIFFGESTSIKITSYQVSLISMIAINSFTMKNTPHQYLQLQERNRSKIGVERKKKN